MSAHMDVYQRRLAEAVAASEVEAAPALARAADQALGEQRAALDGLRQAIAQLMVDERERAQQREAKLERRIAELERGVSADQARIAELEKRLEAAAGQANAAESSARKLESEMTEARAQQREAKLERRISELERAAGAGQAELERRLGASERRADAAETHAQAAQARAQKVGEEAAKERTQLRKDFIELGDDLRARMRDASAAAVVELRSQIVSVEERLRKIPSPLPVAKDWAPNMVTYRGGVVTHKGASWQATKNTAQAPGGSDWVLIASAGRDGIDGRSVRTRGLYNPARSYEKLDIVFFAGEPFMAMRDAPGAIPGDGWMKLATRVRRGEKGERGAKGAQGAKGEPGAKLAEWRLVKDRYAAVPFFADNSSGPVLRLRPLFERYYQEVSE